MTKPGLSGGTPLTLGVPAAAIGLFVLLFLPDLNANAFIDSPDSVLRLPFVSHVNHIPTIFTREFTAFSDGHYRPLAYALLALVRTFVTPQRTVFWHVWLLTFHAVNAVLVYAVARRFTKHPAGALLAGAIFLFHPAASAFG
ncbi:MAG TPA: hypothetical protein VMZ92_21160, partial [Planctomycetota bacterium]|nr:hypothetical protein [Planctomycetota bacterium]